MNNPHQELIDFARVFRHELAAIGDRRRAQRLEALSRQPSWALAAISNSSSGCADHTAT
jgi:hypothetical protein